MNDMKLVEQILKARKGAAPGFARARNKNVSLCLTWRFALSYETPLDLTPDDEIKRLVLAAEDASKATQAQQAAEAARATRASSTLQRTRKIESKTCLLV